MSWQEIVLIYISPAKGLAAVRDILELGGPVLWVLFGLTLGLWTCLLQQYYYLLTGFKQWGRHWQAQWQARQDHHSWYARQIRAQLLSMAHQRSYRYLRLIHTLIAVAPLLGLLGTVMGMMHVFDVVALSGTQSIRTLAIGIAQATLPTMTAMTIALTGLFFVSRLERRAHHSWDAFRQILDRP